MTASVSLLKLAGTGACGRRSGTMSSDAASEQDSGSSREPFYFICAPFNATSTAVARHSVNEERGFMS